MFCSILFWSGLLFNSPVLNPHYNDVIMGAMASQITSLTIVYSTVYSGADQRKHQSSASLAFVWGIHRGRWIPRTKCQLRGKCFHLMTSSCNRICLGYHRIALDIVHISHRLCRSWLMPSSTSDKARLKHILHGTVIKRSIFSQILTIDNPYLARKGEVWGVCCDSKILLTFCHCYRSAVCHIVINWTAL